jgi:hypothetical protein
VQLSLRPFAIAALVVALWSTVGRADAPKITSSDFNLDLFQGPVITASRVIGLAGAYVPLAEGCEGEYSNTASPSVRVPYSLGKWDYDICFGFTNPGAFAGNDFENRGADFQSLPTRYSSSVTFNAGLQLQYGTFGVTVVYDQIRFGLENQNTTDSVIVNRVTGSLSNAFLDDQLLLGIGFRTATLDVDQNGQTLLTSGGASTQFGAILKPKRTPVRIGATFRTELDVPTPASDNTDKKVGDAFLPAHLIVPWEVEVGAAVELGKRPLNPGRLDTSASEDEIHARYENARTARVRRGTNERDELDAEKREDKEMQRELDALEELQKKYARLWSRHEVLLLVSLLVTGNAPNAVGISDFLAQPQRLIHSGENIVVSPRLALETEIVPNWLMVRGGTYLEPARYADAFSREHFTLGFDIRLFKFNPWGLLGEDPWRLRLAADLSARYFNYGISFGKYH